MEVSHVTSCHVSSSYVPIMGDFLFWFRSFDTYSPSPGALFFKKGEEGGEGHIAQNLDTPLKLQKKRGDLTFHFDIYPIISRL